MFGKNDFRFHMHDAKYLTQEEVKRFFCVIKNLRDRVIFDLMYKYGLRASEVGLIMIFNVDLKDNWIEITRLKGSQSHEYPLFEDSSKLLKKYIKTREDNNLYLIKTQRNTAVSRKTIFYLYRRYYDLAGLKYPKKRHPHILRHTAAVHYYEASGDTYYVKFMLGHRNIMSTVGYIHLSKNIRRKAFMKVSRTNLIVKTGLIKRKGKKDKG